MNFDPIPSRSGGAVSFADNVLVWLSVPSVEVVKPKFESVTKAVVALRRLRTELSLCDHWKLHSGSCGCY